MAIERTFMTTRRRLLIAGPAAAFFAAPAAAQKNQQENQQEKPQQKIKAVATISILADLVRNAGGDRVDVTTLVGPNSDAHVYSPTPGDVRKLAGADVIFVNGLGLEGWMTRLVETSGTKAPTVVVSKGIAPRNTEDVRDPARVKIDPHAWQAVANAEIYVENIRDGLIAVDPAGKSVYDANAAAYLGKLDALQNEVEAAVAKIPADRRTVIINHDSFRYFSDAYGLTFIAPEGVSTEAEPSAKDVAKIIMLIRTQKIPAVFLENISDPRLMDEIARETGVAIGGKIYSDALSEPGGPAATYIELMRHNVYEFSTALIGREGHTAVIPGRRAPE
jgi:zinc/manganese transport system substrate-binding protein